MKMNEFKKHVTGIQHLGLPTKDMDATLAFYQKIGFEIALDTKNGNDRVVFLKQKNLVIETYESEEAAGIHGAIDHVCIDVDDIEAVYQLAQEAQLELLDDGIQFLPFWENGVKFFNVLGPNHEKVEFGQILV